MYSDIRIMHILEGYFATYIQVISDTDTPLSIHKYILIHANVLFSDRNTCVREKVIHIL